MTYLLKKTDILRKKDMPSVFLTGNYTKPISIAVLNTVSGHVNLSTALVECFAQKDQNLQKVSETQTKAHNLVNHVLVRLLFHEKKTVR